MGKFKMGDRVRLVEDSMQEYGLNVGDTGIVKEDSVAPYVKWDKETEHDWAVTEDELAPVPAVAKWEPKVGDRVRYKDSHMEGVGVIHSSVETAHQPDFNWYVTVDSKDVDFAYYHKDTTRMFSVSALSPAPAPATLTIEAGRYYTTRDGRKVGPASQRFGFFYLQGWHYNSEGRCGFEGGDTMLFPERDLVSEWVEPAVVAAPTAKFKVGDLIRATKDWCDTKAGDILPITGVKPNGVWATDRVGDSTFLSNDEFEPASTTTPSIVALIEDGVPKPATKPFVHQSEDAATKEAERLALLHAGSEFGVFTLATSRVADVVEETVKRTVLRAA